MRVVMFTGKGGVGTTTAAAGTATVGALRGLRTLAVSFEAGAPLSDAFDVSVGDEPVEVDDRLWALHLEGADATLPPDLPGRARVASWLRLHAHLTASSWDLVVVDAGPAANVGRLIRTPAEARGWLRRGASNAPGDGSVRLRPLTDEAAELDRRLIEVQNVLGAEATTARLVLTPESVPLTEARRTYSALAGADVHVDGVLANRVFPWTGADGWRRQWAAAQSAVVADAERAFAPVPVLRSVYRSCEPVGVEELAAFAVDAYGVADPFALDVPDVPAAR